jgi:1-acyl-sn-glycerol-3-phosphate acyltransferase
VLDLDRLRRIKLSDRPLGQRIVANLGLSIDFRFPRKTEVVLENEEWLPQDGGCFLAMNHTDRYNYWPLQYKMYRRGLPFTATWVKGKYYENSVMARFMDLTNNIPIPSRGFVLITEFRKQTSRVPSDAEYRLLKRLADNPQLREEDDAILRKAMGQSASTFGAHCQAVFDEMIDEVIALNRQALWEKKLNVLVFPSGTRSKRVLPARTGIIQMAQHLGASIIPIGCSGCDKIYPGSSPFAKGGRVTYRAGLPLTVEGEAFGKYRVPKEIRPLTKEAEEAYGVNYEAMAAILTGRINDLVDPEYRSGNDASTDQSQGTKRFV